MPGLLEAAPIDLNFEAGTDFYRSWAWHESGVLQPLDEFVAKAQIRRFAGEDEVLVDLAPYLTIDQVLEEIQLFVPGRVSRTFDFPRAKWDLFLLSTLPEGEEMKFLRGEVRVKGWVTSR